MAGIVSDLDSESSIKDWQETAALLFLASLLMTTALRKVLPPMCSARSMPPDCPCWQRIFRPASWQTRGQCRVMQSGLR